MQFTMIVSKSLLMSEAIKIARKHQAKLIINANTRQALITNGPVPSDFVTVLDPLRYGRADDAQAFPD